MELITGRGGLGRSKYLGLRLVNALISHLEGDRTLNINKMASYSK